MQRLSRRRHAAASAAAKKEDGGAGGGGSDGGGTLVPRPGRLYVTASHAWFHSRVGVGLLSVTHQEVRRPKKSASERESARRKQE